MERVDFIILDDGEAVWDASTNQASWDIADYMFKHYEEDDEIFLSLHSSDFSAVVTTPSSSCAQILIENVELKNQQSTNRTDTLAIKECNILFRSSVYYLSPNNSHGDDLQLNVSKFYKIKLKVMHEGGACDLEGNLTGYKFILKVSYKKRNN